MRQLPARDPVGGVNAASIAAAVATLRAGRLVIVPTDTVYGIAADGTNEAAVSLLFVAKGRPRDKPIALLAGSAEQAASVVDLTSPLARRLIARWWPGPLTLVAAARQSAPPGIAAAGAIGVRVPDAPAVQALALALGRPLAVTSANRSGDEAAVTFDEAVRDLAAWVALALDGGPCPLGLASTVADITGPEPRVLRQGSATLD